MNARKVWLMTGAGRGLGVDIAKAVLIPFRIRTELLRDDSTTFTRPAIGDSAERTREIVPACAYDEA